MVFKTATLTFARTNRKSTQLKFLQQNKNEFILHQFFVSKSNYKCEETFSETMLLLFFGTAEQVLKHVYTDFLWICSPYSNQGGRLCPTYLSPLPFVPFAVPALRLCSVMRIYFCFYTPGKENSMFLEKVSIIF